jgi:solute carrier family 13 (sodium-dependent dicarboxylate transporter), member 2/3/5
MAYKMLGIVGEKPTSSSWGLPGGGGHDPDHGPHRGGRGHFPPAAGHHSLYSDSDQPTRFGKGLFIGMAWAAGAGSIITFLGAARGVAAAGMYKQFTGQDIGFFELSWYMLPLGLLMVFAIWLIIITFFKPELPVIEGLREKAGALAKELGPMNVKEKIVVATVIGLVTLFMLKSFLPVKFFRRHGPGRHHAGGHPGLFLTCTLTVEDLETIPWNIILLFGGAMSIGFCLWNTKAAEWLAVHWLTLFQNANWLTFVLSIAFFVLVMTNFIMNVAAIAIALPVSLVIAKYLGWRPRSSCSPPWSPRACPLTCSSAPRPTPSPTKANNSPPGNSLSTAGFPAWC